MLNKYTIEETVEIKKYFPQMEKYQKSTFESPTQYTSKIIDSVTKIFGSC